MEKIVIISKQKDCDQGLIAFINALFPECEISIVFSDMEGTDAYPDESLSECPLTDAKGGTMSDILIMHGQPNMHELLSQKLAGSVKPL
ncbi:MAG TPA: hypothetical protein ENF70_00770 [Deltaproteobacteria bacterium]|nr:hypothetical protein [Deltaproteobacteria bacterium]HDH97653.1 hypothetical protein [Deltaproteobacteria bacterium]